jgi:glycosyltransferase involved in cell wall biosynthesis
VPPATRDDADAYDPNPLTHSGPRLPRPDDPHRTIGTARVTWPASTAEGEIAVTVVVPAYRADRTLPRTVAALLAQRTARPFEVVVVASADPGGSVPDLPADPRLRVVTRTPRLAAATARNLGAGLARGAALAFTDADVAVPPDWLDRLTEAAGGRDVVVAGSVRNGTPASTAGTAEYLVQFLDLAPERPPASADHGATCNLYVPRALWARYGPFPEDMGGGEDTLLTGTAHREGVFLFAPDAPVTHLNRTRLGDVLAHQWAFGRFTARLARRDPELRYGWLQRSVPLAPVAAAGRLASIARRSAWLPGFRRRWLRVAPAVAAAVGAWGAGLAAEGLALALRRRSEPVPEAVVGGRG